MSENSRPKRSKKRNESGLHGKHYERRVFALIALKCFLDKKLRDFWILSNPQDVEKFDDIILFTEHCNGEKKLLMIQVKHKEEKKKHPVAAKALDDDKSKLSLKMYEKAYSEIIADDSFLELHKVPSGTEMFFILFNNCEVYTDKESDNISFCFNSRNSFKFVNTSTNPNSTLRIVNKSGKYDENFLDQFYFYIEQIEDASINAEIGTLLGINAETVEVILNFFYAWLDPKDNYCAKLWKLDVKIKLLDILFGDFEPPGPLESINDYIMKDMIREFHVTLIEREDSAVTVWGEIFQEMKTFYGESLRIAWRDCIPKNVEELLFSHVKNSETFLINSGNITFRLLYMFMVTDRRVPFFIKTTNKFFNSFKDNLLPALNVYSVVFNVLKENLNFLRATKVFQDFSNVTKKIYGKHSKKLDISFQGKPDIDLYELTKKHTKIKRAMSVDNYIELLRKKYLIGEPGSLPEYYVNRQIKIPILNDKVLNENDCIFFIFNFPKFTRVERSIDFFDYLFRASDENYEESNHIVAMPYRFDISVLRLLQKIARNRTYCILNYIGECHFQFMYSNGSIEDLRPHLSYVAKRDAELTNIYRNFNVNIISNNAGMGKTMLLNFLHSQLPPDEWVVYIDLKKYKDKIKRLETVQDLVNFTYHCQTKNVSEDFDIFLKILYSEINYKIVWLIDDYEEVNEPSLLKLFVSASAHGFKIWIAVRPYLKLEFEEMFKVFSMEITELSKDDQKMFIERYLKQKGKPQDDIKRVITNIDNIRHLLEESLIGTCQQTMMLTEIFLSYKKEGIQEKWHIHDIYEEFLKLKVTDNFQKDWYIRTTSKLALKVFFKDEALCKVFDLEEFDEDARIFKNNYPKDFFITSYGESDVPIFSHMTYAEFLAARWLLRTVKKQLKGKTPFNISTIFRLLHLNELTGIKLFFDNMVTKELPLHSAIVNNDQCKILELIDGDIDLLETDFLGRSIFHLLSSYGSYFDIGVDTETNNLVRNLDTHLEIINDGKDVLLLPVEPIKVNSLNARIIIRNLLQTSLLNCTVGILKPDTLLKLDPADHALLSGSLVELDQFLEILTLASNSPVSLPEEMKYPLLYYSIRNGYKNIFSAINVNGLNNLKIGETKISLLHLAVSSKNMDAVERLTNEHPLTDWGVDQEGNTPVHVACLQNTPLLEHFFTKTDIDTKFLNKKNVKGQSHLHLLARRSHRNWIERIINDYPGLDVDNESCDGNTPFILSIIFNNIDTASILQDKGANVNHCNKKKMSALHYAASKGFLDCVNELVLWDADVNHQDSYGKTPLMKASSWGHKDVVKLLLAKKAKVNLCDNNKWTALHCAVRRDHLEIIDLLLKYGADINCVNKKQETPLVIACKHNFPKALELLLSCEGIQIGKRAFRAANKKCHKKCIDLLQARVNL